MRTSGADGETHLVRGISRIDRERPFLQLLDIADDAVDVPLTASGNPVTSSAGAACGTGSVSCKRPADARAMLPR